VGVWGLAPSQFLGQIPRWEGQGQAVEAESNFIYERRILHAVPVSVILSEYAGSNRSQRTKPSDCRGDSDVNKATTPQDKPVGDVVRSLLTIGNALFYFLLYSSKFKAAF